MLLANVEQRTVEKSLANNVYKYLHVLIPNLYQEIMRILYLILLVDKSAQRSDITVH